MKTIIQATVISLGLHALYLLGTLGVGYYQTMTYEPAISGTAIQSEVAFGAVAVPPMIFILTFIGTTIIAGIVLSYRKKIAPLKSSAQS